MIVQLYLCKTEFVKIDFDKIKAKLNNDNFNNFFRYFDDTYNKLYDYRRWKYFN